MFRIIFTVLNVIHAIAGRAELGIIRYAVRLIRTVLVNRLKPVKTEAFAGRGFYATGLLIR